MRGPGPIYNGGMKVAIFAFRGEATRLLGELETGEAPFSRLFRKASEEGMLDCVCRACSSKMGTLEEAERQGLPIYSEMSGHPSMARYIDAGYQVIVL